MILWIHPDVVEHLKIASCIIIFFCICTCCFTEQHHQDSQWLCHSAIFSCLSCCWMYASSMTMRLNACLLLLFCKRHSFAGRVLWIYDDDDDDDVVEELLEVLCELSVLSGFCSMVLKWVLKCLIFGFMVMCIYEHSNILFLALDFVLSGGLIR